MNDGLKPIGLPAILTAEILIVDDKEDNVRLLEGMLRVEGYRAVSSTRKPEEVCELYRINRYSLILLDLQMPGMDGFEVMRRLRDIETEGYLPVLVITAQPAHKLRALDAGARDFLSKPFDIGELRARVRNALELRLLHTASRQNSRVLEATLQELRASHETIRPSTLREQTRLREESALAQQTQESLLPRHIPQFENDRIHAWSSPTRYVGGDFYEFIRLPSSEWTGVLVDVSGKGMPAALLSSMMLGALSAEFRTGSCPEEVLKRRNLLLREKSLPDQYATIFLFVLNAEGAGRYISAAHNSSWLFRSATGKVESLKSRNFAIGMFDEATYGSCPLQLRDGDILVASSDGLTDMQNPSGEMFRDARLLQVIRQEAIQGSEAVQQSLLHAVAEFACGAPQTVDITFLVVEKLSERAAESVNRNRSLSGNLHNRGSCWHWLT